MKPLHSIFPHLLPEDELFIAYWQQYRYRAYDIEIRTQFKPTDRHRYRIRDNGDYGRNRWVMHPGSYAINAAKNGGLTFNGTYTRGELIIK